MKIDYPRPDLSIDQQLALGCGDACPLFPGRHYEDWVLDDPAGLALDDVRPIREEIERRVRRLLDQIEVPARA
jgi:arsenate reductase (thioredoxin)